MNLVHRQHQDAYKNPPSEHLNLSCRRSKVAQSLKLANMVVSEVEQAPGVLGWYNQEL